MAALLQDLRYALRTLFKSPGYAAIAIITLALGIGANTAIFSVVNAALLKPLHFKNPSKLVLVWEKQPTYGLVRNVVAPPNFFHWQQQNTVFSGMSLFLDQPANFTGTGEPEQVYVESVSPNFFSVLGVNPILGRGFAANEDQPGKSNVAVLSYGFWKAKFGGDTDVIGKTFQDNGEAVKIIGVAPPDFNFYIRDFSFTNHRPQMWSPLEIPAAWHAWSKVGRFLRVVARVKTGVSLTQAQAQMNVIASRLAARYPVFDKGWGVALVPLREQISGAIRPALLILLGAVGFVLLIACANISSLLLSRAVGRQREIAIRVALGASRKRIAQQLLVESILLSVFGGIAGAFVALWATRVLVHAGSGSVPGLSSVVIDWRVLAFTASVTLLAGLAAGFLPSFMATRAGVATALPEGGRSSTAGHKSLAARNAFVIAEISLALVLLAGASLLIQSFVRLMNVNPGFQASHLLTFQLNLPEAKYKNGPACAEFFTELLDKIRGLPGAISASADVTPPFSGVGAATDFAIVGEAPLPPGRAHGTDVRVVEPDYFRTMGISLLRGRTFAAPEFARQSNVVVINEALANKYFPGKNPVGQKIIIDMKETNLPDEIIGVVGNVHESSLKSAPDPVSYWPYPELPYNEMSVVVRTATPPLSLVPAVRGLVRQIDDDQPIADVSTMDQLVSNSVAQSRFTTLLLSAFAALALVLACIGIYGVMAYSVAQRTHEFGIRMALGAQKRDLLRLVLMQGARLALAGVAIGIAAALLLTRLMATMLFGIGATDPLTFAAVSVLLVGVALLACYFPARRAMRVDPMAALRYE